MTTSVLEALDGDECRRLLDTQDVGRLAVVRGGYPVVIPVNYALYRGAIVVRTDAGGTFSAARRHRASFEVDHVDRRGRTAWSVLVQGFAVEILPGDAQFEQASTLPVEPSAPGARNRILLLTPISVTGRRIRRLGQRPPGVRR